MASPGDLNASAYIVIKHGNRRRLLSKPPTFDDLMRRACEIFEFAPNTQVCAYFQYRNHLDNWVEMELDPTAYHFLKTGDELEWKCFDKPGPIVTPAQATADGNHDGPGYLGFGSVHIGSWVPFRDVPSGVPSSMRARGWGSTPQHQDSNYGGEGSTDGWGRAPDITVRSGPGNESGGEGWSTSRRNSWGEDVFTAQTDTTVSGGGGGGGGDGNGDGDGANMWLHPIPCGPLPERRSRNRWSSESSPPRRRRH